MNINFLDKNYHCGTKWGTSYKNGVLAIGLLLNIEPYKIIWSWPCRKTEDILRPTRSLFASMKLNTLYNRKKTESAEYNSIEMDLHGTVENVTLEEEMLP